MSLDQFISQLNQKLALAPPINAKVKFNFTDDGVVFVDATQTPPKVSQDDGGADLTLSAKKDVLEGIMNGTQDPNMAFMMGKLKVKGSMGLAMKLNSILED